jgi:hypothetical protein
MEAMNANDNEAALRKNEVKMENGALQTLYIVSTTLNVEQVYLTKTKNKTKQIFEQVFP